MSIKAKIMILLKYGGSTLFALVLQLFCLLLIRKIAHRDTRRMMTGIWLLFFLALLLIPLDALLGLTLPVTIYRMIVFPALMWQFATGFLVFGLLAVWLMTSRKTGKDLLETFRERRWRHLWIFLFGSGLFLSAHGLDQAMSPPEVVVRVIPVRGLESRVTILHVTDAHVGYFFNVSELRRITEGLPESPDLIVFTGDQLHGFHPPFLEAFIKGTRDLSARLGVFQVPGNHDHRLGAKKLLQASGSRGMVGLRNEHVVLDTGKGSLVLAGIDDLKYGGDLDRALAGKPGQVPVVLLSHRPEVLPAAAAAGVDVVLSGHTHGGQICLGSLFCLSDVEGRLRRGIYRRGRTVLSVSSGVGTTGLPFRFFSPPDVGFIILVPES